MVEVTIERIEMWNLARKIAASPNGLGAATLQRAVSAGWQSLYG
jgi:hypothetical protein